MWFYIGAGIAVWGFICLIALSICAIAAAADKTMEELKNEHR